MFTPVISSQRFLKGVIVVSVLFLLFAVFTSTPLQANPFIVATKTDFLTVDIDADNFADPGDTIRYTTWVTNTGSTNADSVVFADTIDLNTTLVAGSLRTSPIARHDSYASLGNVGITVPAANGVLVNDNDPDGQSVSVIPAAGGTANGGAFAVGADGAFSYLPPAGFEGADSFPYTVQDSDGNQDPATAFIVVNEVIWFIDNSQSNPGSGVLTNPFNSLSGFNSSAADEAGDIIFLYSGSGNYSSGPTLLDNQILIGQGATASIGSIAGITVPPFSNALPATGGARPTITSTGGDGVVVAQNNLLRGFNVGNTAGVGISDNGGTVGTLIASEVAISGIGGGIEADNGGTLAVALDSLSASSSSDEGIDLENVSGSFAVTGTSGALNMTGVPAVVIDGNPSLNINALAFQSVSSSNAAHGISIRDTSGSFAVTGTGAANSGGTLSGHSAEGVFLNNAANISLTDVVINQSATSNTQGIDATGVSGLTLVRTTITAGSNNSYALLGSNIHNMTATSTIFDGGGGSEPNIDGVRITNLLGTNTLTNSTFRNGKDINLLIENNSNGGGLDTLTISGSSFSNSAGGDHLQVEADGTANLKLVVNASGAGNTTFSGTGQDGMQLEAEGNATFQAVVTQATISGNLGSAVNLAAVSNGQMIARVHNLTGLTSGGTNVINMINFDTSTIEATIENNTVNMGGSAFNGIRVIQEGNGTITTRIANNSITGVAQETGILVQGRAGTGGNGALNATINNNIVNISGANSLDGIEVTSGSSGGGDTNSICLNMFDNNSTSANFDGYFLRQRTGSTFRLQDFPSGTATNWVTNVKGNVGTVSTSGTFVNAPAPCATPTVPVAAAAIGDAFVQRTAPAAAEVLMARLLLAEPQTTLALQPAALDESAVAARSPRSDASQKPSAGRLAAKPLLSGETINITLGELNPGQEVRITFDVTIDSPQSPATNAQVCNQGVVGGSNFANVATDDLAVGGSADPTCTLLAPGTIVIAKDQSPDGSSNFGFSSNIPGNATFNVSGDTSVTLHNVPPGSYTVTEDDPAASFFTLTNLSCDDGGSAAPSTTDTGTRTATVNLESGETVTCTFTNTPANEPPVAVDDSYSTDEDMTLNVAAPGVLDNDTDADGDALTSVKDSDPSHGTLTLNSDGSFSYEPDANYCGPDSFTYHANDGQADSNVATADITVECVNDPPVVSVSVVSQTVQYSDHITNVTINASDVDSSSLSIGDDAFSALNVGNESCAPSGDGVACTWTLSGQVLVAASSRTVTFTVNDGHSDGTASTQINVNAEDATVAFDGGNEVSVLVDSAGGDSGPFSLTVYVSETEPDQATGSAAAGDIALADVSMTLAAVGPGGSPTGTCSPGTVSGSGYDAELPVTCTFDDVPVNTYTVEVTVNGGYYAGSGEDVLTVYDPSLGFTTGGGWFYWPGSEDPGTGYPGDRTNFGYTMKYNKKGTNIQGSLLLIRHLSDGSKYRIKSNALDALALGEDGDNGESFGWAVFNGKATYLAPSMTEPEGNYRFTVYVEDRNEPGSDVDRFWLEVRDKDGYVVPDLSLSPDAQANAVDLAGGNIIVPHGGNSRRRGKPG